MPRKPAKKPSRKAAPHVPVKLGALGELVGFNLRIAQEATYQAFAKLTREVGEQPRRFAVLTIISENPGISQTALSTAAGRDKSTLTPVLEDMVRRGLVQRRRMDTDRRVYCLTLTAEGARSLAKLAACARTHEQNLDRAIGPRDRDRFVQTLKRIFAQLG